MSAWEERSAAITKFAVSSRNDQNFAGACDGINAHITEAAFWQGHKNVAGACNLSAGILSVPKAMAAIAWAPPPYDFITPAIFAAASVPGFTFPSAPGGVSMIIR